MNYRSIIRKIMSPDMKKAGFSFCVSSKNDFCFKNEDGTRNVLIDTERYGPHKLRFAYQVFGKHYFRFYLEDLDPAFCPVANQTYETMEELIFYLENITWDTIRIILPYLDVMEENYVEYEESFSQQMGLNFQERIFRFQEKWGFDLKYDEAHRMKLDAIMDSMRTTISARKQDFYRHKEEFLDLSACYGELLNVGDDTPGQWARKESTPGHFEYVVGPTKYNPLWRAMFAWNFGPEVALYSLQGRHFKVEV